MLIPWVVFNYKVFFFREYAVNICKPSILLGWLGLFFHIFPRCIATPSSTGDRRPQDVAIPTSVGRPRVGFCFIRGPGWSPKNWIDDTYLQRYKHICEYIWIWNLHLVIFCEVLTIPHLSHVESEARQVPSCYALRLALRFGHWDWGWSWSAG